MPRSWRSSNRPTSANWLPSSASGRRTRSSQRTWMRVHLITAESPESRRLRRGRLIQFPQLTMPLIAALTPSEHTVSHTDEIVEPVRFDVPADLVAITSPTPSALHAYGLARDFRRRGVQGVIGSTNGKALTHEASRHAAANDVDTETEARRRSRG